MNSAITTAITSVIVFLFVILIHEFGHFITAKLVGIKVNEFSIGMGPQLFKRQGAETLYSFRAFPVGGFVSMEGEDDCSDDLRSFSNAAVYKRIIVVAAGAFMNFALALTILFFIGLQVGLPTTTISGFTENSSAQVAGLRIGDEIVSINGIEVKSWDDVVEGIKHAEGNEISVNCMRDSSTLNFNVKPNSEGLIGIIRGTDHSISAAIKYSISMFSMFVREIIGFFASLFRGEIGLNDVSGPVGIVVVIGKAASIGIMSVLMLMAFININVGFFNLLPIPALDGSLILILLIEAVRKKPLAVEKQGLINLVGFVLLIGLLVIVTFKDIFTLFNIGG